VVVQTGEKITHVQKGDKVLLSYSYCEECEQCTAGHKSYCYSFNPLNFAGERPGGSSTVTLSDGSKVHAGFFGQSSFSQHAIVNGPSAVKVSPETRLELFAPLGCGVQTGVGCVMNVLKVQPGSSVAVFGVGPVGMAAVMASKMVGAGTIIAVDLKQERLMLAKDLGATHTILGSDPDVVQQIRKICPPVGVNYALDGSGVPAVINNMIESLGARGRGATVGAAPPGTYANVDIFNHLDLGREYVGCCSGNSNPGEVRFVLLHPASYFGDKR
jgi:Zn-dependent alcohol dehydrogenase